MVNYLKPLIKWATINQCECDIIQWSEKRHVDPKLIDVIGFLLIQLYLLCIQKCFSIFIKQNNIKYFNYYIKR